MGPFDPEPDVVRRVVAAPHAVNSEIVKQELANFSKIQLTYTVNWIQIDNYTKKESISVQSWQSSAHGGKETFKCKICDAKFPENGQLIAH